MPRKSKDLIGQKIDYLEVLSFVGKDKYNHNLWLCKCKCGNKKTYITSDLLRSTVKSCGCYNKEKGIFRRKIEIDQKFGNLIVLKISGRDKYNRLKYLCKCDCGNEKEVISNYLLNGDTKSCGCLIIKNLSKRKKDLTGKCFGRLMAIKLVQVNPVIWECKCSCGNIKNVKSSLLLNNKIKSCGCLLKETQRLNGIKMGKGTAGEKHHNWKGGITSWYNKIKSSSKYLQWRKEIYNRDNYICQKCGDNIGHNLNAHHIFAFNKYKNFRMNLNNGITLCNKCHINFHSIFGTIYFMPENTYEFIQTEQIKNQINILKN